MGLQLQIETTSTCNAACVFCPYPTSQRWGGLMKDDLFKRILDDASTVSIIDEICLTGLGEPTLDPKLVKRVAYARNSKPKALISIYTNGVHMTPKKFDALAGAGMSYLVFSLNATTPEQHEAYMGIKGKFGAVCNNAQYAIDNADGVKIEVRAVIDDNWTGKSIHRFYSRWGHRDRGGSGILIREGNWAGDNRTTRNFNPKEACYRALGQIYVLFDGRVTTCCFDPAGTQVFGDLSKQTIREVYGSEPYFAFRKAHFEDRADEFELCAKCTRI